MLLVMEHIRKLKNRGDEMQLKFTEAEKKVLTDMLDEKQAELVLLLNRLNQDTTASQEISDTLLTVMKIKEKITYKTIM